MISLLEVLITFVGAMLILALVAQSVQELIKVVLAVKGSTARRALQRLVTESTQAEGLLKGDAAQVVESVVRRLANLGQYGVRPGSLRLDKLTAPLLGELILSVEPENVGSLKGLDGKVATDRLEGVASRAVRWFPLSMDPVDDRYRRRMRGFALLSSAVVVLALNADALSILRQARHDPAFRDRIQATAQRLDSLDQRVQAEAAAATATGQEERATGDSATQTPTRAAADSARAEAVRLLRSGDALLLGGAGGWRLGDYQWWIGILISVLLVSLGAPFWHDALEALFGVKNRIRAQAAKARSEALPEVATVRTLVDSEPVRETKVTTKPVSELT
jgi:hypothetical protein